MSFQEFHHFNRLVRDDKAEPLTCGLCHNNLITRYDEKGKEPEPILWCWACDDYTTPGLNTIERVRTAIKAVEE